MIIKRTTEEYIQLAKELNGNEEYDYSKTVYVDIFTDINVICKDGEFIINPIKHLKGYGFNQNTRIKLTTEKYISIAKFIYGDYFDYSKLKYVNSYSKIDVICPIHGLF